MAAERGQRYDDFRVVDVSERGHPAEKIVQHLVGLIRAYCLDLDFIRDAAQYLGRQDILDITAAGLPGRLQLKRGAFGECLAAEIMESFHGYRTPVRKLRYTITGDQTLPGTDVVALTLEGGDVQEVRFIESKLRTGRDRGVALEAYRQLEKDSERSMPIILPFIARELRNADPQLYRVFMRYMRDRKARPEVDTYGICVTSEASVWNEETIERLDGEARLHDLVVHVVAIDELRELVDRVFEAAGVVPSTDDD